MIAAELLPLISPKLHPRYSPNLHAWISKHWKRTPHPIVVTNPTDYGLYIGLMHEDGWMSGTSLNAVLCNGVKEKTWAMMPNHSGVKAGIDETFWGSYIKNGRCAIDRDHGVHFVGDQTRWKAYGNIRECQWCSNHTQVKKEWTETVEHSAWVAVAPEKGGAA
jgi:hypothetical protein